MPKKKSARSGDKVNTEKWGKPLMDCGFTVVPDTFLQHQNQLGLDPLDLNILLQMWRHWWSKEGAPRPGKRGIAGRIGVSPRTVQRRITKMENLGLIKRHTRTRLFGGSDTNAFHFDGLIEKATVYAKADLEERANKKRQREEVRRKRLRPKDDEAVDPLDLL